MTAVSVLEKRAAITGTPSRGDGAAAWRIMVLPCLTV
jgi:hypothetical protein